MITKTGVREMTNKLVVDHKTMYIEALERIAELEATIEAMNKITRDKYRNANEVFGLNLGEEIK
jgi:hypothetical protein